MTEIIEILKELRADLVQILAAQKDLEFLDDFCYTNGRMDTLRQAEFKVRGRIAELEHQSP